MKYKGDFEMYQSGMFKRDGYKLIDENDVTKVPQPSVKEKAGGPLKWLVRDAQKHKEKAQMEAPGMLRDANYAKSLADWLNTRGALLSEPNVDKLISQIDNVKHWIRDNKTPLGLSQQKYEQMRMDYNSARDAWQKHRGTRTSYSAMGAAAMGAVAMGAAPMGGAGYASAPYTGTIERSPDEIEAMKQSVAHEARVFLGKAIPYIQNLANPFSDAHALKNQ
jgi:hypothetical protein